MGEVNPLLGSLDALVAGKRASPRQPVCLTAVVKGLRGEFPATIRDLSREGVLVTIPLSVLAGDGEPLGPAEQFALLERHFRDSFDLHAPDYGVVMEAQVVRLLVSADDDDILAIGCRFVQPLTDGQQAKLGLVAASDTGLCPWGEATTKHPLSWAGEPTRPVTAMLLDEQETRSGPLYLGPVGGLGRRCLLVRLWDAGNDDVIARLSDGCGVRVMRGSGVLFECRAELVSTRYTDTPRPGVEVLLACSAKLPRAVRKHFRKL